MASRPVDPPPGAAAPLAIVRDAPARRVQLDAASWVDVVDGFVADPGGTFEELLARTTWLQGEVLRYDRYVPEQRLGAGLDPARHTLLRQAELHLRGAYRVPLQGVAAVLYRDGTDFQGLHSDRELRWLDDTRIAIIVLGARRPFVVRRRVPMSEIAAGKVPAGTAPDDIVLTPGEGDLLVMGGACQRDWLHGVPAAGTDRPRISLTWRWSSRQGRPDTNPGYFDGRQFADRPRRPGLRTRPAGRQATKAPGPRSE